MIKKWRFFSIRTAVIFLVAFIALYLLINLKPFGLERLKEITGGHSILDMETSGFSADKAYTMLGALGGEGREYYLKRIIPMDFPFPLAYALFYFVTLSLITGNLFQGLKRPWMIGLVGLAAGLLDWSENVVNVILLVNYPERLNVVAGISSMLTQLKGAFILLSIGLIVFGCILILIKKFRTRKPAIKATH